MKLRTGERCPIHQGYFCCGRSLPKSDTGLRIFKPAVYRMPADNERGYIEVCSKGELRRRLPILLKRQNNICGICGLPIEDCRDAVVDHIEPRPAGCKKDSHWDNIQAAHSVCNLEKGSKRNFTLTPSGAESTPQQE